MVKCSDVSEKHTAFLFRMTELVQADAQVKRRKSYVRYNQMEAMCSTETSKCLKLHLAAVQKTPNKTIIWIKNSHENQIN